MKNRFRDRSIVIMLGEIIMVKLWQMVNYY